jgi:integrase
MKRISTFNELLNQYTLEKPLSEATVTSYTRILHGFITDTGLQHLNEVSLAPLLIWRKSVIKRTSDITWNTYLRHMRALWKFAIYKEYVPDANFFKELHWGKYKTSNKQKILSATQLKMIMVYLSDQNCTLEPCWFWKIVIRFIYFTGIRRKQLVTLNWNDLDLEKQTIYLSVIGDKIDTGRILPLQENIISDLREYQLLIKHHYPKSYKPCTQLFNINLFNANYKGVKMTEGQVSGLFRRLCKKVGVKVSPHMLRHTMATEMAKTGQIKALQKILGHADIKTTMNFYVHPDLNQLRHVLNSLNDI